jgi:hypothetical protein
VARANALCPAAQLAPQQVRLVHGSEGMTVSLGSARALTWFLNDLGIARDQLRPAGSPATDVRGWFDPSERQRRQVRELKTSREKTLPHEVAIINFF